ncbi:erythrocyte membrane protein 1, PfEMP1, putative [Plasmodium gaboni]|uniref:Erythrocyte membrane protein 1, PfEMP1, putative n=1 Tax=Plasmodium gaboni TaxID=647221 RepID=A0ABY0L032_9APIC|nr:erythrocyte membrane protein 1, PfEMP1, putative [Plasmodium gaboni]
MMMQCPQKPPPIDRSHTEVLNIKEKHTYMLKEMNRTIILVIYLLLTSLLHQKVNMKNTNNNVQDTYTDDVKDNSDIPINKWTEEEWNELKKDFISNMLQNDNMDLPNENIIDDNIYKNIQPDIVDSGNPLEKPFITSIQDRFLDNHEKINYDIDWNVPKNITTNNVDIPKYVTSNDKYSGIDLINDALNSGNDIYDELLKRKENELFGTKHPKHTSTNRVVKQIVGDPILNQLDLYDKWLDRHRSNQWKNKPDMSNDEWNRQHDDISIDEVSPFNNRDKLLNTNLL